MTASDESKQGEKKKVSQQAGLLAGSYSLKQCDTMGPRTQAGDSFPRQKDICTQLPLSNRHTQLCMHSCPQGQRITKADSYAVLRHCIYDMKPFSTNNFSSVKQ